MPDFRRQIQDYYNIEIEVIKKLNFDELNDAMNIIYRYYQTGARIFVFGNGGSAATASHMVVDFNKGACIDTKQKFNFVCLNDNVPLMMAIANDLSYDDIFLYQLQGRLKKDDLIIAISGSGNSRNVVKAVEYAKELGCNIIGITGYSGGKLRQLAGYHMHVNFDNMQIAEDLHMTFDHMMMTIFWKLLKD